MISTLVYNRMAMITAVKRFIAQAPEPYTIKLLGVITYVLALAA